MIKERKKERKEGRKEETGRRRVRVERGAEDSGGRFLTVTFGL